ncbi:ABC transporter ATP-binding protein [Fusobacterium sp. PH5-44]|uniref:ABC transporter ATP-binding protein n=1 Tax=unclassified Fusobacterium TaxID=2648384 RepID=UPI003D1AE007
MILLNVKNLSVSIKEKYNEKILIDDLSFTLRMGQCIGILGESGSGKSLTCKAIMGLLDENFIVNGNIIYKNKELLTEGKDKIRAMRGKEITMVMQSPMTSFDPLYTIGYQIKETLIEHTNLSRLELRIKALEILESVHLKNTEEILSKYPHQLSGGMLQRIMIGLALALETNILIADEPTTAIDSITQYEIVKEFKRIKEKNIVGMLFISHDLGVISQIADYIIVLNNGKIVSCGPKEEIMKNNDDVHTQLLINKKKIVIDKYKKIIGDRNGGISNVVRS